VFSVLVSVDEGCQTAGFELSVLELSVFGWTARHPCDQAIKGVWGMPRRREAMKDVIACEKLRGAGK
jgi:hypothetical protein